MSSGGCISFKGFISGKHLANIILFTWDDQEKQGNTNKNKGKIQKDLIGRIDFQAYPSFGFILITCPILRAAEFMPLSFIISLFEIPGYFLAIS